MKSVLWRASLFILACLFFVGVFAAPLSAQQGSGVITGRTSDTSGAVIPGVTVTLSSPAVMGTREAITDERGGYRIDLLPVGTYSLKFELPGFATLIRDGIQITGGFTATINVTLEVSTQAETITVTGSSPVVDTSTATVAVNLSTQMLTDLPTGRDYRAHLLMAPGVMARKFDVGGSQVGTSTGFRTYGTDGQNYDLLDGVITSGYYGDFGSIQEVQVVAASKGAEVPNAGAYVNSIVKSGSNNFHGGGEAYWETPKLQGRNLTDRLKSLGVTETNRIDRLTDFNVEVGGPVRKDRLWWYTSLRDNHIGVTSPGFKKGECTEVKGCRGKPIGTYTAINPSNEDEVFFTRLSNATMKVNYQLNVNNQFNYLGNWSEKHQPYRGGFGPNAGFFNSDSAVRQTYPTWLHKGQWTSTLTSRITLDNSINWFFNHWPYYRRVDEISRRDLDTQLVRGGFSGESPGFTSGSLVNTNERKRLQYLVSVSMLTDRFIVGSHNTKVGYSWQSYRSPFHEEGTIGHIILYYRDGFRTPNFIETLDTPFDTETGMRNFAFYINDSWKMNSKLTVNLGFRMDRSKPYYPQQEKTGEGPFQARLVVPRRDLKPLNGPVPRVSATYDVFGNGKTALKASFGRYVYPEVIDVAQDINPMTMTVSRYAWDGTLPFNPAGRTPLQVTGGRDRDIDPSYEFPHTDEYTAGLDQELMTDLSLRVNVVRKFDQNARQLFNIAIPFSAYNIPVNGVDQGRDGVLGTSDDKQIALFSLDPSYLGKRKDLLKNNPALDNANTVLDITVVKRASNRWTMLWGWDYLRRKTWVSAIPEDPNNLMYNRGENFNTWHVKTMGTYDAPYGIKVSGMFRAAKGDPYGRRWNSPRLNQGVVNLMVEPIGTHFMDTIKIVDFRLEKTFQLSESFGSISAMFDLFNVLNNASVTGVNDLTGTAFGRPTRTLEPRIARMAVKYQF